VFLTIALVTQLLQPFDNDDDRWPWIRMALGSYGRETEDCCKSHHRFKSSMPKAPMKS
jgi:hypothetical protein